MASRLWPTTPAAKPVEAQIVVVVVGFVNGVKGDECDLASCSLPSPGEPRPLDGWSAQRSDSNETFGRIALIAFLVISMSPCGNVRSKRLQPPSGA